MSFAIYDEKTDKIKRSGYTNTKTKTHTIYFKNSLSIIKANSTKQNAKQPKQSVVKLLSNLGANGAKNALFYVCKNSENNLLTNEWGDDLSAKEILNDWQKDFSNNENSKEVWHLVFSLNENYMSKKDIFALHCAVNNVMHDNFSGHKFVTALHTHQNNPHIHVIVNKRNIYTKKKIHFDSKEELKNLFDKVRDDFTNELNGFGFNYVNKNSMQKDLESEIKKATFALNNDNETNYKIQSIFERIQDNIYKNIANKESRNKAISEQIDEKIEKNKKLYVLYDQYKKKKNKKFYAYGKELQKTRAEIISLCDLGIKEQKEIKKLQNNLGFIQKSMQENYYKQKEGNYKILRDFCNEFEKKYLKTADKKSRNFYFQAKKELDLIKNNLDKTLLKNVDSALLYSKLFCKKENCFDIIKKLDLLEKNAYALKGCDFLTIDEKEKYEKMFENNNKILKNMLENRFEKISKIINEKGVEKNSFIYKEYEKAGKFLGKITTPEIKQEKIKQNYNHYAQNFEININTERKDRGFSR